MHADWSFGIGGVNGPRRLQLLRAPDGWTLKAIRINGIDVTDRPLVFGRPDQSMTDVEVVLTDRINQLTGTITDDWRDRRRRHRDRLPDRSRPLTLRPGTCG